MYSVLSLLLFYVRIPKLKSFFDTSGPTGASLFLTKGPLTLLIADYCKYKSGIYYTFEVKKKLYIIEDQIYQERKQIIFRRK